MPLPLNYSKHKRIRTTQDYRIIYEQGKKTSCAALRLYFFHGERKAFGIVISKRIRGAVVRNRYKRILREYFRLKQNQILPGTQIVAVVNQIVHKPTLEYFDHEISKNKLFIEHLNK